MHPRLTVAFHRLSSNRPEHGLIELSLCRCVRVNDEGPKFDSVTARPFMFQLAFSSPAEPIQKAKQAFAGGCSTLQTPNGNFLKGVQWSPDGACLLTASDDNRLRVFDLPPDVLERPPETDAAEAASADTWVPGLHVQERELVYDYSWYSCMAAADPASCCFATTCRAQPLHLWDGQSGTLRCTYRAYDAADEVTAALSLGFNPAGTSIWAGFNRTIRVFDLSRPGRDCTSIVTHSKTQEGLPGLVSCLAFTPEHGGLAAAGAYSGCAALFDEGTQEMLFVLSGHKGGITQVHFSPDGNFLYTGARRDPDILCWDVRSPTEPLYRLQRSSEGTNQRIQFTIEPVGRHLATGGQDGNVTVFDLADGSLVTSFKAAVDTVNGLQFHPFMPLAATASGHRRYPLAPSSDDSASDDDEDAQRHSKRYRPAEELSTASLENVLRLWRFEGTWLDFEAAAVNGPDAGQQVFQEGASAAQMAVSEMDATGTGAARSRDTRRSGCST